MKNYLFFLFLIVMILLSSSLLAQATSDTAITSTPSKTADSQAAKEDTAKAASGAAVTSPEDTIKKEQVIEKNDTATTKAVVTAVPVAHADVEEENQVTHIDSLNAELSKYRALYTAIKEKVIKRDFDPLRMSLIIDSLASKRDSTFSGLNNSSAFLKDSISVLNRKIQLLNERLAILSSDDAIVNKLVNELKQLKELLDARILTQAEFDIMKTNVLQKWR